MNQLLNDKERFLNTFDTFMIDEAHELRKLQVVMLAIIKNHLLENPQKKLIVTSATLESKLFKEYFQDLSTYIIEAKTPTYGVKVQYNMFPDLETDIPQNTVAHLKEILDVIITYSAHHQDPCRWKRNKDAKYPCFPAKHTRDKKGTGETPRR
jgi:HrpA-like RNA helicase